jgi:hypothetical protein
LEVSRAGFLSSGRDWPLTVEAGALTCDGAGSVVLTADSGGTYAVNGTARTHTPWPGIDSIWADAPGDLGVLPAHPGRAGALLDEPGLIHDQHPAAAQPLHHIGAQLIAHGLGVPVRGAQQPLHPVRRDLSRGLGQRPAVLPLQLAEQAAQIGQHPGPRLGPGERTGDPPMDLLQARRPVLHLSHQTITAHPHTLLPALR